MKTKPTTSIIKKLKLVDLNLEAGTDTRHEINEDTVTEYGERMNKGDKFPPLIVYDTGEEAGLVLADGFHRNYGAERQGIKSFDCEVRNGSRADAVKYALGCNVRHGLRRTTKDKQNAVSIALKEFPTLSDRAIAEICAVGHPMVGEMRRDAEAEIQIEVEEYSTSNDGTPANTPPPPAPPAKRTGRDGKQHPAPPPRPASKPTTPPPSPKMLDATGFRVPEEIIIYWSKSIDEAKRLMGFISEVRVRIKQAQENREPMFREIDHTDSIAKLDQVYEDLKRAQPFAVCPDCNGIETKTCTTCKGKSFVSSHYWKHCVPDEKKTVSGRA